MIFLWELIEDYKSTDDQKEKDEIFRKQCDILWNESGDVGRGFKTVEYIVPNKYLDTPVGKVFYKYEKIKYPTIRKETDSKKWNYLLRQKINNLYAKYIDKGVCETVQYIYLVNTPRRLFFQFIKNPEAFPYTEDQLEKEIHDALYQSEYVRAKNIQKKPGTPAGEWYRLCEGWMRRCFENCILLDDWDSSQDDVYEAESEDNFYISYISKSLEGYVKNYLIEYKGLKRQRNTYSLTYCALCGSPFYQKVRTNRKTYCEECRKVAERARKRKYYYLHHVRKTAKRKVAVTRKQDRIVEKEID